MADLLAALGPDFAERVESGEFDAAIRALDKRRKKLAWENLPNRIVLLRHGESEGNVNHKIYTSKGDSLLELTANGFKQAKEAGARLRDLVGSDKVFVAVSTFERTQQTLYGLYEGGFPRHQVGVVHHDPRIREQEFGNFQNPGLTATVRAEEQMVGRFYYRRPNAESSADVFDRVAQFWNALLEEGPTSLLLSRKNKYDTALIVTHGLTIRLLLMVIFQWSVTTFESVFNAGNCHHITLRKNLDKLCYEISVPESFPPQYPWATRNVWIKIRGRDADPALVRQLEQLKEFRSSSEGVRLRDIVAGGSGLVLQRLPSTDEAPVQDEDAVWEELDLKIDELSGKVLRACSEPFTVTDYLTIPPPRSMQIGVVLQRLVRGHGLRLSREAMLARAGEPGLTEDGIDGVDWWEALSYRGKRLHMRMDKPTKVAHDLDTTPGGRSRVVDQ